MQKPYVLSAEVKHLGHYAALESFTAEEIICYGDSPVDVVAEAKEKGCNDPVLIYIPEKDEVHFF